MMKSELFLDVRYYETDQMGIVHHSNYVRYFECGRTDMLKKVGLPIERIEEAGVMLPVVSVECRYKTPAVLGDTLRIVTSVDEVPRARLVIRNEVYNPSDQLVCEGSVTLGFIDSNTRRPVRCPEMLVKIFEEHINN
ncbi:MAG: acyl-CoA thioesterase [Bacteroidales bacterium]|nr:acyl-CoA thioesterase [Bacteroidales bacterium]MBR2129144.1 acyl-CoA thioesterase [Bacteroidales bacterium]